MFADLAEDVPRVAAALAASLIEADGVIEDEEIEMAVTMGRRMLPGFSEEIFKKQLAQVEELPSAYELASSLKEMLEEEDKDTIIDYLAAIASADQIVVEVEHQELEAVAMALGVPMPPLSIAPPGS